MRPDAEKHSFTFDVLPQYGIALSAMARMQLVVEVRRDSGFGYFDGIQDDVVYLPFCWLDEGLTGPDEVKKENVFCCFCFILPAFVDAAAAVTVLPAPVVVVVVVEAVVTASLRLFHFSSSKVEPIKNLFLFAYCFFCTKEITILHLSFFSLADGHPRPQASYDADQGPRPVLPPWHPGRPWLPSPRDLLLGEELLQAQNRFDGGGEGRGAEADGERIIRKRQEHSNCHTTIRIKKCSIFREENEEICFVLLSS